MFRINSGKSSKLLTSPLTDPSTPDTKKTEAFTNAAGYIFYGAPRRIRTSDLPLRRGLRYPAVPWEHKISALRPKADALFKWFEAYFIHRG